MAMVCWAVFADPMRICYRFITLPLGFLYLGNRAKARVVLLILFSARNKFSCHLCAEGYPGQKVYLGLRSGPELSDRFPYCWLAMAPWTTAIPSPSGYS